MISTPIIAWLVLRWGSKSTFIIMGLLGLIWLVGWWSAYTRPKSLATELPQPPVPARQLLSTRFVAFFTVSKVFVDPVWYFFVFWFPKYLGDVHHFSLEDIGWKGWIPYFTATAVDCSGHCAFLDRSASATFSFSHDK